MNKLFFLGACLLVVSPFAHAADDMMMQQDGAMMTMHGMYSDYTAEAVKKSMTDGHKVVLVFTSKSLKSTLKLEADLTKMMEWLPATVDVYKVNFDVSPKTRKAYGITKK